MAHEKLARAEPLNALFFFVLQTAVLDVLKERMAASSRWDDGKRKSARDTFECFVLYTSKSLYMIIERLT